MQQNRPTSCRQDLGKANNSSMDDFLLIKQLAETEIVEAKVVHKLSTQYVIQIEIPNAKLTSIQQAATKKAIGTVKQDLLNDGFDETTLTEIEDYLTMNKFTASEIQTIFKSYKKYDDSVAYRIRKPKTLFTDSFGALINVDNPAAFHSFKHNLRLVNNLIDNLTSSLINLRINGLGTKHIQLIGLSVYRVGEQRSLQNPCPSRNKAVLTCTFVTTAKQVIAVQECCIADS